MILIRHLALAAVLPFSPGLHLAEEARSPDLTIGRDARVVRFSHEGVLTGIPRTGLSIVDGPRVNLSVASTEWFSVRYETPTGAREFVGVGRLADWADREGVTTRSAWATEDTATAVVEAGELEVTTVASFDQASRYVHIAVTLTNRSQHLLKDVLYTREWRGEGIGAQQSGPRPPHLRRASRKIARRFWTFEDMPPGGTTGLRFSYEIAGASSAATGPAVPLSLWTSDDYPEGLPLGATNGISWGDYDADGHIDLFALASAHLWRNVGGTTWQLAADLDSILPFAEWRYGVSFGDYDNDGLPDIATEPRIYNGDEKLHLLRNLGGAQFDDVADDPAIMDSQPWGDSETYCWADVDADADLDLFVPTYPAWVEGGPGNFFLENLGPTGPGGAYRFAEATVAAGLTNPPLTSRPEGAQFADVDFDGDLDLFSNGTLYRNVSSRGSPRFEPLAAATSGIGLSGSLDEGAAFIDYDLDGDDDLFIVYTNHGVRIWENLGNGTFFAADQAIVDDALIGLNLGLSAEDWDNDGDVDITTRQVFRRNMLMEEGERHFEVAAHGIPAEHLTSATPAWGDWDGDGDLDCALGNWAGDGHFYQNDLYTPSTPLQDRRYVRVVLVRDAPSIAGGLLTEYGAAATVRVQGDPDSLRRRRFTASSHGYLNQNEYALHFALPADPAPADASEDVRLDVSVDFPGLPHEGLWRIDKRVNPALGGIDLADLTHREIRVSRCGVAMVDGMVHEPAPLMPLTLATAPQEASVALTGSKPSAAAAGAEPALAKAPAPGRWVGLAFDTMASAADLRVAEIMLDGQLETAVRCGEGPFNIALWDVTDAQAPVVVAGSAMERVTSSRNHRSRFTVDLRLAPQRRYRLVARVSETRSRSVSAGAGSEGLAVQGSFVYDDPSPCSGEVVVLPEPDPRTTSLAIRYAPLPSDASLDPIGDRLTLSVEGAEPVLAWPDVGAAGYRISRCSAASGPCAPAPVDAIAGQTWTDDAVTTDAGEILWYEVDAVNACTMSAGALTQEMAACSPYPCTGAAPAGVSGRAGRAGRPSQPPK